MTATVPEHDDARHNDARPVDRPAEAAPSSTQVAWRLLRCDPIAYAIAWGGWVLFWCFPVVSGLLLLVVLDDVSGHAHGSGVWAVLAVLAAVEVGRWLDLWFSAVQWHGAWVGWHSIPRLNILRSLAVDRGPAADQLPGSPGEAVSRFRDDCQDLAMVLDVWLDVSGAVISSAIVFVIMAAIDLEATLIVAVPIVVVVLVCRWLGPLLRAWRRTAREATAEVTGFVGDTFGAITAVKAAGAEQAVESRFAALGHTRAAASRLDQIGTQLVLTLSGATGNLGLGLALVAIAPRIRHGAFSVGDLGLFTTYIIVLANLPRWSGRLAAYQRQAEVSVGRLADLTRDRDPLGYVSSVETELRDGPGPFRPVLSDYRASAGGDRLQRIEVKGLTARFPTGGIDDIDLALERGSFTVVTGPIGSGKSTLLRAVLGLVPTEAGTVSWNGRPIDDLSTFMTPPRAAYLPQVPRLFSETLADTVLLRLADDGLADALRLACLDDDLEDMPAGLATMVGPKGVRLSGGQIQRTAAARAFVRKAQLLVVDDLSSALDVDTEAELWRRLFAATAGDTTVLVVTHRPSVIAHADQVLTLTP